MVSRNKSERGSGSTKKKVSYTFVLFWTDPMIASCSPYAIMGDRPNKQPRIYFGSKIVSFTIIPKLTPFVFFCSLVLPSPSPSAPEKIENVYQRSRFVAQSFVHGDGLEANLVGIVVPDEEELLAWAKKTKFEFKDYNELVSNPKIKTMILEDMLQIGKEAQLKGFEQVKTIHLTPSLFSVENELLTPTFKLKRNVAAKKFEKEIAEMYGKVPTEKQPPAVQIQSKL